MISAFYFTCNHLTSKTEIKLFQPLKLFQNCFSDIEHVGKYSRAGKISFWNIFETILFHM